MILYITYSPSFDDNNFKIWLNHYIHTGLDYKIFVLPEDNEKFTSLYPLSLNKIITEKPENCLELTIHDFLFTYDSDDNGNIVLNYNFNTNFINDSIVIGKIFNVPMKDKPVFTSFEIPDFIVYQHAHHTNYTVHGIKLNGGNKISDNIVCLSTLPSLVTDNRSYMECFGIYGNLISFNVYNYFMRNIIVNKEKMYGILWFPKSACTSIGTIFCEANKIKLHKDNMKNLSFFRPKYRYNPYLQGFDFIVFGRNPYHRFVSSFIDKHVLQYDLQYLHLPGYKNFIDNNENKILNLTIFIKNNYISDHYLQLHKFDSYKYVIDKMDNIFENEKKHTLQKYRIEDGLNEILCSFLSKYHDNLNKDILDVFENSIVKKDLTDISLQVLPSNLVNYSIEEWKMYLKNNTLNYDLILTPSLKEKIYSIYEEDFNIFGYEM